MRELVRRSLGGCTYRVREDDIEARARGRPPKAIGEGCCEQRR